MSPYKIFETETFQKECLKLVSNIEYKLIQKKLVNLIYPQLREEPHFGPNIKKLRAYVPESYRFRIGNFRLFYTIDEKNKTAIITAIKPRKTA